MNSGLNQDKIWAHFQSHVEAFAGSHPRLQFLLRKVAQRCPPPASLLNVGVGDGYLERLAQARGYHVSALDPDPGALGLLAAIGIAVHCGRIEHIPCADSSFDVVTSSEVFEHLSSESFALGLREIARVLRPGGFLLGTVPSREVLSANEVVCPDCGALFHRWGHHQSFDEAKFVQALPPEFEPLICTARFFWAWKNESMPGRALGLAKALASRLGRRVQGENLFFIARRRSIPLSTLPADSSAAD